jgi:hypothetical protein
MKNWMPIPEMPLATAGHGARVARGAWAAGFDPVPRQSLVKGFQRKPGSGSLSLKKNAIGLFGHAGAFIKQKPCHIMQMQ